MTILTFTVTVTFESISVTITGSPETSCLLSGSDATVTCNVEGFPRPEIDFLIGGVLVVPGAGSFDRVTRTEADQILVENVGMADEGSYGCRVANDSTAPITTADFQYCSESLHPLRVYLFWIVFLYTPITPHWKVLRS